MTSPADSGTSAVRPTACTEDVSRSAGTTASGTARTSTIVSVMVSPGRMAWRATSANAVGTIEARSCSR